MKNLFKKTVATVLTLLILCSCFCVQGFALFDKITDVEIKAIEKFSYKMIEEEFEFLEEMGGAEDEEDYYYFLECDADVTISTGEVISVDDVFGSSKDEKRSVDVFAYVDIRECRSAYESGKLKVPVYITVTLYSSIGVRLDKKEIKKNVTFPEKLVKKLTLASGKIGVYALDYTYIVADIEGLTFDIVYGDGSKKRAKVKKSASEDVMTYYTLDGEEIAVLCDYTISKNGKLYASVYFQDYELRSAVTVKEFPIKSIKINNVTFDDDFKEKTITYTITKSNGKTYKKTYEFGKPMVELEGMDMAMYNAADFEGFAVVISVMNTVGDEYPPQQFKDVIITLEGVVNDSKSFEGPKQEGTKLGELIFKIVSFIKGIFGSVII